MRLGMRTNKMSQKNPGRTRRWARHVGNHWKKYLVTGALAAGIAGVGHQISSSHIDSPDFTGRQKFWTLNRKSMEVYRGNPGEMEVGDSKYRLGKTLANMGFAVFDIRVDGKDRGRIESNFELLGKEYSLEADGVNYKLTRPMKLFRSKWTLEKQGRPFLVLHETTRSAWLPGVHEFGLFNPAGEQIGRLNAQWGFWRFLTRRRDYSIEFDAKHKGYLSEPETIAVLTILGNVVQKAQSSSSSKK